MLKKLDKLLLSEILTLMCVLTAVISSVMIMAKLPKYAGPLFAAPNTFVFLLMLLLYALPSILKFTVPVSLLLSCAIVTMRMSMDRELEAWLSCGVSIRRVALMPTILGIFVMLLSLASAFFFEPYSNQQFQKFKWLQARQIVESIVQSRFTEKVFIYDLVPGSSSNPQSFPQVSLYFDQVNATKTEMNHVFLAFSQPGEQYSSLIVGKKGFLRKDVVAGYPDYRFRIEDGVVYSYKPGLPVPAFFTTTRTPTNVSADPVPVYPNWTTTRYKSLELSLVSLFQDHFKMESSQTDDMDQLYPRDYWDVLKKNMKDSPHWQTDKPILEKWIFLMRQICVPLSTLFLPVVGVCIGVLDPRKKQIFVYVALGVVLFVLYASLSVSQQFVLRFFIPPYAMLIVTPCLLFAIAWVVLRWRLRYPPSCSFFEFLKSSWTFSKRT